MAWPLAKRLLVIGFSLAIPLCALEAITGWKILDRLTSKKVWLVITVCYFAFGSLFSVYGSLVWKVDAASGIIVFCPLFGGMALMGLLGLTLLGALERAALRRVDRIFGVKPGKEAPDS